MKWVDRMVHEVPSSTRCTPRPAAELGRIHCLRHSSLPVIARTNSLPAISSSPQVRHALFPPFWRRFFPPLFSRQIFSTFPASRHFRTQFNMQLTENRDRDHGVRSPVRTLSSSWIRMDLLFNTIQTSIHSLEWLHTPTINSGIIGNIVVVVVIGIIMFITMAVVLRPPRTLHRHVRLCIQPCNVSNLAYFDLHIVTWQM